ncbi:hypothetical protein SLA2020_376910 [Shorea laevis]
MVSDRLATRGAGGGGGRRGSGFLGGGSGGGGGGGGGRDLGSQKPSWVLENPDLGIDLLLLLFEFSKKRRELVKSTAGVRVLAIPVMALTQVASLGFPRRRNRARFWRKRTAGQFIIFSLETTGPADQRLQHLKLMDFLNKSSTPTQTNLRSKDQNFAVARHVKESGWILTGEFEDFRFTFGFWFWKLREEIRRV